MAKTYFNETGRYESFVQYRSSLAFFFLAVLYKLSLLIHVNDILFYRIVSGAIFAIFSVILVPKLMGMPVGYGEAFKRRVMFIICMYFFFAGYFLMPFTDVWGIFFLVLALINIKNTFENLWAERSWIESLLRGVMLGIEMKLAVAFRSSFSGMYFLLGFSLVVWIFCINWYFKKRLRKLCCI